MVRWIRLTADTLRSCDLVHDTVSSALEVVAMGSRNDVVLEVAAPLERAQKTNENSANLVIPEGTR